MSKKFKFFIKDNKVLNIFSTFQITKEMGGRSDVVCWRRMWRRY